MHAARLMTLHAAWKMDTQGVAAARKEIAMIKFYGATVLHDVVDRALQAHGGLGYSTDLPLEAMYRFARAARIYDGPDEVHRASVARQVLRGISRPPAGRCPDRVHPGPARGRAPTVRRPARGRHDQRLSRPEVSGRAWCRVHSPVAALQSRYQLSPVTALGSELWWPSGSPSGSGAVTANQFAIAELSC